MRAEAERVEKRPSQREIRAEAASAASRAQFRDELWGDAARPAIRALPPAKRDRWPIIATIIAIVLGSSALIAMRERIVRIFPPMATGYRLIGAPVNLAGLELRDVRARIVTDDGRRVLVTEGEIVNLRREPNRPPPLSLSVRGANGLARYVWTTPAPKARLEGAETIAFSARLASPPEDGTEVFVRFAQAEDR
ncbi:hypothetical protein WOC76_10760 [Methylocystis sp. IM3]|uniref:hypothetical protein n=1 Tax=unclassified Methylocystis TaxID=2625913 RepID=UPI00311A13D0